MSPAAFFGFFDVGGDCLINAWDLFGWVRHGNLMNVDGIRKSSYDFSGDS